MYVRMYIYTFISNEKTTEFPRCSGRERDFIQNFQDAPHRSALLDEKSLKFEISRMLSTRAQFSSKNQDALPGKGNLNKKTMKF